MKNNNVFISRAGGVTYVCNANGQKIIVDDKRLLEMADSELIKHYQSLNIFKETNERRC